MVLVFRHPLFLFSDSRKSNYLGPKAHGPVFWADRIQAVAEAQPVLILGGSQVSRFGPLGWPQPVCCHHCLVE